MILKRLKINNFVTIAEADLILGSDVYLITGQNLDENNSGSNGAGKSLLCQSIVWCLFDELLRKGMKKDGVIGKFGKYCEVSLELIHKGLEISIRRYRNHPKDKNGVEIICDGQNLSQQKDSNAFIEDLLGISKKVIFYSGYIHNNSDGFLSLTPSSTKKVISEIIGLEEYDKFLVGAKSYHRDLESMFYQAQKDFNSTVQHIKLVEEKIKTSDAKLEGFRNRVSDKKAMLVDRIDSDKRRRQKLLDKIGSSDDWIKRYDYLAGEMDRVDVVKRSVKKKQEKLNVLILKMNTETKSYLDNQSRYKTKKEELDNLSMNTTGVCRYCFSHFEQDKVANLVLKLKEETDDLLVKVVKSKDVYERREVEINNLKKEISALDEELDGFQGLIDEFTRLSMLKESFVEFVKEIDDLERSIKSLTSKIKNIDEVKEEEVIRAEKESHVQSAASLQVELVSKEAEILDITQTLAKVKEIISECMNAKNDLFNGFIFKFEQQVQSNLDEITEGEYTSRIEVDKEDLRILFSSSSKGDDYYSFHTFSTGERARINRAVIEALNQMLDVGFIIDDEGMNGVSEEGISDILDFVLSRSQDRTVLFCGHQTIYTDYFEGYSNIHVVKKGGNSSIEVR